VATTLPTPIAFRLPEDWRPVPPDEVDAPNAAFVAMLPDTDRGFTANVTIDGEYRPDAAPLTSMADQSVQTLREALAHPGGVAGITRPGAVAVLNRAEAGSAQAPALTQTLKITTPVDGADLDLLQSQVYLSVLDSRDPAKRAVIRLVLTATAEQHGAVLPDFQWLVSTVRPDDEESAPDE
jgi:hypothetical protein